MAFVTKRYIADTHFGHPSILTNCNRPFGSTEEMDAEIARRWNSVVKSDDDLTYHLGDFGFPGRDLFAFKRLFHSLRGKKVLILGNHDMRKDGSVHPEIAALPWHLPPTHLLEARDEGRRVILCHYSMRAWPAAHHGSIHFYGHSHGKLPGHGLSRDVGGDMPDVDFTPRTFRELTAGMDLDVHKESAA